QGLPRLDHRALARRPSRRQAGRRVHFDVDAARRPGEHAARHGAAARAPRNALGRTAVHAPGALRDPNRRLALRRDARRGRLEPYAVGRRKRPRESARRARRANRAAAEVHGRPGGAMNGRNLLRAAWACHATLFAAVMLGIAGSSVPAAGRIALATAAAAPLLLAAPGLYRARRY